MHVFEKNTYFFRHCSEDARSIFDQEFSAIAIFCEKRIHRSDFDRKKGLIYRQKVCVEGVSTQRRNVGI